MQQRDKLYEEFLENPRFVRWVIGKAPEDDGYWERLVKNDPIGQEVLEQARLTILAIQGRPETLSKQDVEDRVQQVLSKAKHQEALTRPKIIQVQYPVFYRWVAAASIVLLLGLCWFTYTQYTKQYSTYQVGKTNSKSYLSVQSDQLISIANTDRPAMHVLLPDGSSVVLRKNSRVRYARVFVGVKREVYMSGEAFFEVTKEPGKPFFVYANGLVTKVLGTSFAVKAHQKAEQVIVTVRTGKVAVFAQTDPKANVLQNNLELTGMVLMPNQQAIYDRTGARLTRTEVRTPNVQPFFDFKATPISTVFSSLEKAYGVSIVFDREVMANCSLSATLGDEPLQKKLQWICTILEATYQVNGQQITINGKPCQ